jgi:molybdopterin converting factor small subunit
MSITIHIPTAIRPYLQNRDEIHIDAAETVDSALKELAVQNPEVSRHLYLNDSELNHYINIYLNDEDIRFQEGLGTPLRSGDQLYIIASIAGG